jgi:DMSO reductase family type II enzyme chaperone
MNKERERLLAAADVYMMLSKSFAYPDRETREGLRQLIEDIGGIVHSFPFNIKEDFDAYKKALSNLSCMDMDIEGEYTQLFMTRMFCPPYETSYGKHGFNRAGTLGDINGFYKAFGLSMSVNDSDMADHIAIELEFMGLLSVKEAYAIEHGLEDMVEVCRTAKKAFLKDHLGRWTGSFCGNLIKKTDNLFYSRLAKLTARFIEDEISYYGISVEPAGELRHEELEPFICPVTEGEK